MKILVTGANGYLGRGIVNSLLTNGHNIIATDLTTGSICSNTEKISANLFEVKEPFEFFDKPNVLVHLAWRDGFRHYSSVHIDELPKHYNFLKNMISSGIEKVVVMGSMHEVGFYEGCIRADTPCHPITPYGIAKNTLRDLTQMLTKQQGTIFQWLRGYYIVGNENYGSSIFSKIVVAEEEGRDSFPFTMGQNQYDFINYDDFCNQVSTAVGQSEFNGIINICSGHPEKLADRVERFIRENQYSIKLQYGAYPDRPYDSKAVWGDATKIEKILSANKYKVKT